MSKRKRIKGLEQRVKDLEAEVLLLRSQQAAQWPVVPQPEPYRWPPYQPFGPATSDPLPEAPIVTCNTGTIAFDDLLVLACV